MAARPTESQRIFVPQFEIGFAKATTTPEICEAGRNAARNFKSIVGLREGKNEIVLAIRRHAGRFPVYAVRRGDKLVCYTITSARFMERTGQQITGNGRMIPLQVGIPDSPSVDTVATYDYDAPEFRRDFEGILADIGEIPKKDGLHTVVAAAPRACGLLNNRISMNQLSTSRQSATKRPSLGSRLSA